MITRELSKYGSQVTASIDALLYLQNVDKLLWSLLYFMHLNRH